VLGSFPVLVGLSFVNLRCQFVGPLGNLAGGLDLSVPVRWRSAGCCISCC
jgi:hypothetical protein